MFEFNIKNTYNSLSNIKKMYPDREVGVFNANRIYLQDTTMLQRKVNFRYGVAVTANKIGKSKTSKDLDGYFGEETEASSMSSVWENTDWPDFFEQQLNENPELVYNKLATSFSNAYLKMASETGRGINNRYKHNLYAIGTGQTLMAIEERIK